MSGLLFLLCCILTVTRGDGNSTMSSSSADAANITITSLSSESSTVTSTSSSPQLTEQTFHSTSKHLPSMHTTKTSAAPSDVPHNLIDTKHCLPILVVTGGLIIACAILLISTFMLAWKVCHLSRRVKVLASNDDLLSNTDFWTGKSDKAKAKVETEDREDTVLLGELDHKQSDANGDKRKAVEEEKKEEENKEENKEEKGNLAAAAEESSSIKPQEDASSSPPAEPEAAATSD